MLCVAVVQSAPAGPATLPEVAPAERVEELPRWHVVLLDDDDHSYEYVIDMLGRIFGYDAQRAFLMAVEVDSTGRVIVTTTSRERAELKQEQIHNFGPDPRMPRSAGSMSAALEPAR